MSDTFDDGASQDQADFFTGVGSDRKTTEKGTPAKRMPAFILGEELADLADRDPRIAVMTADLASANRTIEFKERHPERFFNFGIAEKNMVTAAAGMAASGQIPFAASFASFLEFSVLSKFAPIAPIRTYQCVWWRIILEFPWGFMELAIIRWKTWV